jgi:uncharacterized membrane protein
VNKHRLELFSDGVFAIVLTLLVLDLRIPLAHGQAAFDEIGPSLLVHAASFYVVASLWIAHHGVLARVTEIKSPTLRLNLLCLFWATLIPFGAKNAAERPLEPLGSALVAATTGFCLLSLLAMRLSAHSAIDDNPRLKTYRRNQVIRVVSFGVLDLACAAAAAAGFSPWPAYLATMASATFLFFIPSPPEMEQREEARAA